MNESIIFGIVFFFFMIFILYGLTKFGIALREYSTPTKTWEECNKYTKYVTYDDGNIWRGVE